MTTMTPRLNLARHGGNDRVDGVLEREHDLHGMLVGRRSERDLGTDTIIASPQHLTPPGYGLREYDRAR